MQNDDNHSTTSRSMSAEEQDERRKQIKSIMRDPNLSQQEKNRSIQALMDGRRRSSIGSSIASTGVSSYYSDDSGDAMMLNERTDDASYGYGDVFPDDHRSVASEITHASLPLRSYRQIHGRSYSLQDWNDHDRVVAAANATNNADLHPAYLARLMELSRPPCQHYERNCTIVSPCCGLAFGCRICHDDCPVLPPPMELRKGDEHFANKMKAQQERRRSMPADLGGGTDEENHHPIDRFKIAEIICRECFTRQSSKTNECIVCHVQFGEYHCNICNLWMSKKDSPYHCSDCGFCRVGGRENFRHCHDCGMCIDAILFDDHNCKSGKYMSNCPICQEDLFSSRHASHEMPCGHAIHWHCFKELTSYDSRCPVCKKTAETPEQMASTWSAISMGISLQPVPPDMARVVNIYCNDCEVRESNLRWHFLGVKCNNCHSYNTVVEQIVMHGVDAAEFLDRVERANANNSHIPSNITTISMDTGNDDEVMEDMDSN
ncbi:RING finger and CHY zinc finger domain-containing protein 1 [Fistulifera solaris]|uniref:RING finger and CHY zinc finger domain-containing protein 1 n=1 Tax=Fistulifera solaris TaxID=1519565 RepID=A0A1Z5KS15_FISSO|nr:RING finger and CHY zinc finger domain-containing protein 1 [Fistulifera solaris]|eukprot:GAX29114.1 RING finger and CHY zinc finger domain-containing protein 1 [Fistulifera solaris]